MIPCRWTGTNCHIYYQRRTCRHGCAFDAIHACSLIHWDYVYMPVVLFFVHTYLIEIGQTCWLVMIYSTRLSSFPLNKVMHEYKRMPRMTCQFLFSCVLCKGTQENVMCTLPVESSGLSDESNASPVFFLWNPGMTTSTINSLYTVSSPAYTKAS